LTAATALPPLAQQRTAVLSTAGHDADVSASRSASGTGRLVQSSVETTT
jgi:hypothetical protein